MLTRSPTNAPVPGSHSSRLSLSKALQIPAGMAARGLLMLIRVYQVAISPLTRPRCRFQPTCSEYARQALVVHGFLRGSLLAIKRIARCHPFTDGGVDLVPRCCDDNPKITEKSQ
ncbi:MAG: membrane protein insertion efficiency factor YidD [Pseudomonadota bacterium]|nr:membrane protein insertion efficiency factor YidD [Pseudomonadota bacterium]